MNASLSATQSYFTFAFNSTSTIQHSTDNSTIDYYDATNTKIASLSFSFVTCLFLCYVITVLGFYGYKTKTLFRYAENWTKTLQQKAVVNILILLAAIFVLIFVASSLPVVVLPIQNICNIYDRMTDTAYALATFLLYFVLWYRVFSSFYANPFFKQKIGKCLQIINITCLVFLVVSGVGVLAMFLSDPTKLGTIRGCESSEKDKYKYLKYIILGTCTITFQFTLLFSFIHPLRRHTRQMADVGVGVRSSIVVVKRAAFVAVVCVMSDLLAVSLSILDNEPNFYSKHIVLGCNLLVNLMGVIFSFSNWKNRLVPFAVPSTTQSRSNTNDLLTSERRNTLVSIVSSRNKIELTELNQ